MGKKRIRKISVFGAVEGDSETYFLDFIKSIYFDSKRLSMPDNPNCGGGNPDQILSKALDKSDRERSFAWIDQDKNLSEESREKLIKPWNLKTTEEKASILSAPLKGLQNKFNPNNRNPVLIVSQPVIFEGFILRVLGNIPKHESYDPDIRKKQDNDLRSAASIIGKAEEQLTYYKANLDKKKLEEKRKSIPELDLLIKMIKLKTHNT